MVSSTFPLSKVAHPRLIGLQTCSCHAFQPISGQIQLTLPRWRGAAGTSELLKQATDDVLSLGFNVEIFIWVFLKIG